MAGIGRWLRRRTVDTSDRPAIMFGERTLTYAELSDRTDRLATALARRGLREGDRVAYLGNNHPSFIETLFACAILGAVFVPLNTRLSVAELRHILDDAAPQFLVLSPELVTIGAAAAAGSSLKRIVVTGQSHEDGSEAYEQLIKSSKPWETAGDDNFQDSPLLIVYTSGTTGRPKGAVLTHSAVMWNAINVITDYDLLSTDRALMISPLFHVAALGMGCMPVLLKGGCVILESRFEPGRALETIEAARATFISGVPTTFQLMSEDPAWATTDISSLRLLTCGGSPVPPLVRDAFEDRGLAFSSGYGMTEAGPGTTLLAPTLTASRPDSAGLPHSFTELRLRTTDGRDVPQGGAGEIQIRGPHLFSGYWRNPVATLESFDEGGWFRTGDIGRLDVDGLLYIVDRLKDMIISGGENIYSAEVEQAILSMNQVTGVAVIGVPHERWGEVPHAVVTLAPGSSLDPDDLLAFLSTRLARYKVPRSLQVVDELPRTASGKVQKQVLRDQLFAEEDSEGSADTT